MSNDRRHSDNSNSFSFNSSRATPKEARPRATHNDRSRSPQRDRFSSGRYDRSEGERYETERSGYDSYKPGQSPSNDMIPAPVRTSSITSPFSPQIPSLLNDSQLPNSVRSPSNSSPYRQPDRPVVSRTNTASSEQPSRPPPEREEEAKIYKAKAAQQKAITYKQNSSTMEIVPSSRAPVETTEPSWKDKAEAAEAGPTQDSASSMINNVSTKAQLFVDSMGSIIDEISGLSSVKSRANKCKQKLDKAVAEFEKSKDHHEKFPSIKDPQVQAKKAADREYKKAVKELEQKEASLRQLAVQITEKALPSILGSSSTEEQQQTKGRLDTVEQTCQKFENLLKEQKAYFDAQQRKSNQQWEQMHKGLQEEVRVLQAEVAKERPRTDKLFSRQNEFAMATQNVSKELGLAKEAIAAFDVPKDLNQKLQNLDSLDQLRSDIKACDKRSASTETGLTSLTATVTSLTHSVDTLDRTSKARDNMAQTLTEAQNKLRETISKVDNKVNAMAEETTSKILEDRVTQLETAASSSAAKIQQWDDPTTILHKLSALEGQLHNTSSKSPKAEEFEDLMTKVNNLDTTLSTSMDRVTKVEDQAKALEDGQKTWLISTKQTSSDLATFEARLAAMELKQTHHAARPDPSIISRISVLEHERKRQTPPTAATSAQLSITAEEFNDLSNQVLQLNSAVLDVHADINELVKHTGETVKDCVASELQLVKNRVNTVESSLKTLEGSSGPLQASFKTLEDSYASIQTAIKSLQASRKSIDEQMQYQNRAIDHRLQNQDKAISDAKNGMVDEAAGSAADIIRSQNLFAPAEVMTTLNQLSNDLEAQSQITGNLNHRMDNLNTGELHRAIMDSVGQVFPNLRNFDMAVQNLNSQMSTAGINMRALQTQIAELQESKKAPVPAAAASPTPTSRQDEAIVKALRAEVDAHTLDLHRLKKLEKLEKDIATLSGSLAGANNSIKELSVELATRVFEIKSSGEDLDGKLGGLGDKVKGIEKKVDSVVQKQQQLQQQSSRAPSAMPRAAFNPTPISHSRQTSTSTTTHRQPSVASTNRQPSVSSDTSSILGKRKAAQHTNGTGGSGAGSPRKPTNGIKHGSENIRGSQNAKRPRRNKIEDDPEMDPDYEEGDPQPGISADENEDE